MFDVHVELEAGVYTQGKYLSTVTVKVLLSIGAAGTTAQRTVVSIAIHN